MLRGVVICISLLAAASAAAQTSNPKPHCATYEGVRWCPVDKTHAFGANAHMRAHARELGYTFRGDAMEEVVEIQEQKRSTFIACGWSHSEGEQGTVPMVWLDRVKWTGYADDAEILCKRHGYDIAPNSFVDDPKRESRVAATLSQRVGEEIRKDATIAQFQRLHPQPNDRSSGDQMYFFDPDRKSGVVCGMRVSAVHADKADFYVWIENGNVYRTGWRSWGLCSKLINAQTPPAGDKP